MIKFRPKLNPITLLLLAPITALANTAPSQPTDLLVELQAQPLLVENLTNPSLSWIVNDADQNEAQTAYRIIIATNSDFISQNGKDVKEKNVVWDSGKTDTSRSSGVDYSGPKLNSSTRYYWAVQTWDKDDLKSDFSTINYFDTALKSDWKAKPIWRNDQPWQNYSVDFDLSITNESAGFLLRANDKTAYKLQLRTVSAKSQPNTLVKYLVNGDKETEIGGPVDLPKSAQISTNIFTHIRFEVNGDTITTFINNAQVDQFVRTESSSGSFGIWNDASENSFKMKSIVVKDLDSSQTLYENHFDGSLGTPFPIPAVSVNSDEHFVQIGLNKDNELYEAIGPASYAMETGTDWVFMRKAFKLANKPIKRAIIYATGKTPESTRQYTYRININGQFAGLGPVRGYEGNDYYQAYDVTSLVKANDENAIGVTAFTYGEEKSFMSQLKVIYEDGTTEIIATDDSWKVLDASNAFPYQGDVHQDMAKFWVGFRYPNENINANYLPVGFDDVKFDDSSWESSATQQPIAHLSGYPASNLEQIDIQPVSVKKLGKGSFILDYGVTVVGGLKIDIDLKKPTALNMKMGEVLNDEGHVKWQTAALIDHNDTWQLKAGPQEVEHYGYRVFRYAELSGLPDFVTESNLNDYLSTFALRYPFNTGASSFESSNKMLNDIWQFAKTSIEVLNQDIYVDSPNRERLPYEADTYIQQLSNYQLDKGYSLARYSVDWLTYHETWPMEWKIYSIMSSYEDFLHTGDDHLLRKNYEILKNKVPQKLLDGFNKKTGVVTANYGNGGPGLDNDIVDWPKALRDGYEFSNTHNVANSFFYKSMVDLADIAKALGESKDEQHYRQLAKASMQGIQHQFFDKKVNAFKDNADAKLHHSSQSNSFVVEFGAASPEQAQAAAKLLADKGMLKGNVYSSYAALGTMMTNGQATEAINQITGLNSDGTKRDNTHNWRHMMELGSGSTMEAWNESDDLTVSHSHAWGTTPIIATSQDLFGIKPTKPAYEEFEIKPVLSELSFASITVPTIRGQISAKFDSQEKQYSLDVSIPANTKATVYIPVKDKQEVYVDNAPLRLVTNVKSTGNETGYVILAVGSGNYKFTAK
jgi:alpha-L-rhamnosidase